MITARQWELKPRRKKRIKDQKIKEREQPISQGIIIRNLLQSPHKTQGFKLHRSYLLENKVIVSF